MKLGIVGDVHWSTYSSIVRSKGKKYSTRLENLINSLNFVEDTFQKNNCDAVIYLGDFFDRPDLAAEEASALKEVNWAKNIPHHFIVGNHESNIASLVYNSTSVLKKDNFIIEEKSHKTILTDDVDIYWLPYIVDDDRKELKEYLEDYDINKKHVVFSHNDIKDIQYGQFKSTTGFSLSEIKDLCDLFINGHIHNGSYLDKEKTVLNLGNISGQNFNEDAFKFKHQFCILDTDTLKLTFFENSEAFNFYKIRITNETELTLLDKIKPNAVLSITCNEKYLDQLNGKLKNIDKISEKRIILFRDDFSDTAPENINLSNNDYLTQFTNFVIEKLGNSDIVKQELIEVCK